MQKQQKILILGGTNFMGKALIDLLSKQYPSAQIHIINRGKKHWDNEVYKQNPNIHFFFGDRREHKQIHKAIVYLNQKLGISKNMKWNAVIDFTAFKWRDIQSIAKALNQKTQLYIFISTDSLYNNTPYNGTPITQEKFSLQQEYKKQKGHKIGDKYGYDKLKCQIYLQRRKHLPYINLRLPDVLGPYDNTNRYWVIVQWIRQGENYPQQLSQKDKTCPLSFVYSADVAKTILYLIKNRDSITKYRSYNLSFKDMPTYKQLIQQIAKSINKKIKLNINEVGNKQSNGMYPSTEYTSINCQLAMKQIKWDPSPLSQCIKECTKFFMEKASNYEIERQEFMKEFSKKVQKKIIRKHYRLFLKNDSQEIKRHDWFNLYEMKQSSDQGI